MKHFTIQQMSDHYRYVRKAVFEEATEPMIISKEQHAENKYKLRYKITDICNKASIDLYRGNDRETAGKIWHHLWTKNRYAGIKAQIASKEINDIESIFDKFEIFSNPSWDIEANRHEIIQAGKSVTDFLNRTGIFENRQTVGNIPKLYKIVLIARKLTRYMENKESNKPVLDFITDGHSEKDVWAIHTHLMNIGYKGDLTGLHFMMDMGFQVMKPDRIITRLFLAWGWLHHIVENLPAGLSYKDLEGKGTFGTKFNYTKPIIYKPVIELSIKLSEYTSQVVLKEDIGWVTQNPLREFDIFIVKYGQKPETDFGITKSLFKGPKEMSYKSGDCVTH